MIPEPSLVDLLSQSGLGNLDKLLICLAVDARTAKAVKEIKGLAIRAGWRAADKLNVSRDLSRANGMAARTDKGWLLTGPGRQHVAQLTGVKVGSPTPKVASSLRTELGKLKDPQVIAFVDQAIRCFEEELYRAAVVLSWVGALYVIYEYVVQNELGAFNAEARRRNSKWKDAKNVDGLARMKERECLDIIESIGVVGHSVKGELVKALGLRNGCGHPNSLKVGENQTAAHIEALIMNVFANFV